MDATWGAILHCRKLEGKDDPHLLVVYVQGDMRDVNHLLLHYPTEYILWYTVWNMLGVELGGVMIVKDMLLVWVFSRRMWRRV